MSYITRSYLFLRIILSDFLKRRHLVSDTESALINAVKWLCLAQDNSPDDGVSEGYHLIHGWLPSYPETTGYIVETLFDYAELINDTSLKNRALRMVNWLVSIQYEDGAIPDSYCKRKMVFDTGQVLFGFVKAFEETGKLLYRESAYKAGKWLIEVQEHDGTWRKFAVGEIPHTYYSRVAWSLTRLHKITKDDRFKASCIRNIEWVLLQQEQNGWFNNASFTLSNHVRPYTHTIAYTIRGVLESGIYLQCDEYINAARKAIDGLLGVLPESAIIYSTYDKNWKSASLSSCLTGNAQLAIILFKLYQLTKKEQYLVTAKNINKYLLGKQELRLNHKNVFGAIAGSYPVWGDYIHFMYPNWAVKFFIDSLIIEKRICG